MKCINRQCYKEATNGAMCQEDFERLRNKVVRSRRESVDTEGKEYLEEAESLFSEDITRNELEDKN